MNIAALILALTEKGLAVQDISEILKAAQIREPRPKVSKKFVPETWHPTESHHAKAVELGISDDEFTALLTSFREWEFAKGKSNFDLAFHRWLRTSRGRSNGTAIARDYAADRADARVRAMVEGARLASTSGRRRWTI